MKNVTTISSNLHIIKPAQIKSLYLTSPLGVKVTVCLMSLYRNRLNFHNALSVPDDQPQKQSQKKGKEVKPTKIAANNH